MSQDQKSICLNCRHWNSVTSINDFGECRRYGPDRLAYTYAEAGTGASAIWPTTLADFWCGEFTARPLSEEDRRFLCQADASTSCEASSSPKPAPLQFPASYEALVKWLRDDARHFAEGSDPEFLIEVTTGHETWRAADMLDYQAACIAKMNAKLASLRSELSTLKQANASISILKKIRDDVFHQEQLQVWSDELLADLSPYMGPEEYDDVVDMHARVHGFLTSSVLERIGEVVLGSESDTRPKERTIEDDNEV